MSLAVCTDFMTYIELSSINFEFIITFENIT